MGELMKIQGAFEFMIILGAVAAFSTVIFGVYANIQKNNNTSIKLLMLRSNVTHTFHSNDLYEDPSIDLYVPDILYVGKINPINSFFSGGYNLTILNAHITATNALVTPLEYSNIKIDGVYLLSFNIIPKNRGMEYIKLYADILDGNTNKNLSKTVESYVVNQPLTDVYGKYSIDIRSNNESLIYKSKFDSKLYDVDVSNHCAKFDWWGKLLPIRLQCNGANWDYFVGSTRCYYNAGIGYRAYCVHKKNENSDLYVTDKNPTYKYNITLELWNSSVFLKSELNNKKNENKLISTDNLLYGNVVVAGYISASGPLPQLYLIRYKTDKSRSLDSSLYTEYSQSLNSLNSILKYYNNSIVNGGSESRISETIDSYDSVINKISKLKYSVDKCTLLLNSVLYKYVCKPYSSFQFSNITVFIKGYKGIKTINFQGSSINIR